ncbi:MAG TPA: hypothetical protein VM409_05630 [Chloroflexia bacterium]|nr:hypothetical protein [Chloroflexia bacterium]
MQINPQAFIEKRRPRTPDYEQDRELALRVGEGDNEALARLLDRHLSVIYRYLRRRLGPGNDALIHEIVEVVFLDGFRDLRPYARGTALLPLRLRLLRLANRHLSRRSHRITAGSPGDDAAASMRADMQMLSPRRQAALALALFEEMAPAEIAGILRTTPAGAMRTLRGALKQMGKNYQRPEFR